MRSVALDLGARKIAYCEVSAGEVIVRKMDRDTINGYVSTNFIVNGRLEMLNTAGNVVAIELKEIKGVYFVRGDITNTDDLERCGIREAAAALVFPVDSSDEADMRSILAVMAIESLAPNVRTVVEANNPSHVGHFRRADADEAAGAGRPRAPRAPAYWRRTTRRCRAPACRPRPA